MRPELHKAVAPEEKVRILRRHFLDKVPVSDLCDELVLNPNVFYSWQETFFEAGSDVIRLPPRLPACGACRMTAENARRKPLDIRSCLCQNVMDTSMDSGSRHSELPRSFSGART